MLYAWSFKIKSAIHSCVFTKKSCIRYFHFKFSLHADHCEGENCLKSACERFDRGWVLLSWNIPCRDHSLHPKTGLCGSEVTAASYCGLKKMTASLRFFHCHWHASHCSALIAFLIHLALTSHYFFLLFVKQLIQHPYSSRNGCWKEPELGSKLAAWCTEDQLLLGKFTLVCIHIILSLKVESVSCSTIICLCNVFAHKLPLRSISVAFI